MRPFQFFVILFLPAIFVLFLHLFLNHISLCNKILILVTVLLNPEGDPLMATLFRNAVIDAMPQAVKSSLEDVAGLNSKTHKEFCEHVSHAVEQHRKK